MAGLGRIQQQFNVLVATALSMVRGVYNGATDAQSAQLQAGRGFGHPLHRKYLRSRNPAECRTEYARVDTSIRAHRGNRCPHHNSHVHEWVRRRDGVVCLGCGQVWYQ